MTATVETSREAPAKTATLAERILAITAEMPPIKATGKSPFSKEPALSIEDVEDAVRPLLVKHGVLIRFSTRNLLRADKEWVAEVTAHVATGIDIPDPASPNWLMAGFNDDWADSGSTPAAAYSFARKSYLKQLFHIAGEDDAAQNGHTDAAAAPQTRPATRGADARPTIKVVSREATGRVCPEDGGDLELVRWDNGKAAVCCTNWREKDGGCKHRELAESALPIPYAINDSTPIPY